MRVVVEHADRETAREARRDHTFVHAWGNGTDMSWAGTVDRAYETKTGGVVLKRAGDTVTLPDAELIEAAPDY